MNGFSLMANSYRHLVKQGQLTEEEARRNIEIYDFLSTCNQDDFCRMVDSSAFNDIIRAFLKKAMRGAGLDEESENRMLSELRYLFDEMSAKEVLEKN